MRQRTRILAPLLPALVDVAQRRHLDAVALHDTAQSMPVGAQFDVAGVMYVRIARSSNYRDGDRRPAVRRLHDGLTVQTFQNEDEAFLGVGDRRSSPSDRDPLRGAARAHPPVDPVPPTATIVQDHRATIGRCRGRRTGRPSGSEGSHDGVLRRGRNAPGPSSRRRRRGRGADRRCRDGAARGRARTARQDSWPGSSVCCGRPTAPVRAGRRREHREPADTRSGSGRRAQRRRPVLGAVRHGGQRVAGAPTRPPTAWRARQASSTETNRRPADR